MRRQIEGGKEGEPDLPAVGVPGEDEIDLIAQKVVVESRCVGEEQVEPVGVDLSLEAFQIGGGRRVVEAQQRDRNPLPLQVVALIDEQRPLPGGELATQALSGKPHLVFPVSLDGKSSQRGAQQPQEFQHPRHVPVIVEKIAGEQDDIRFLGVGEAGHFLVVVAEGSNMQIREVGHAQLPAGRQFRQGEGDVLHLKVPGFDVQTVSQHQGVGDPQGEPEKRSSGKSFMFYSGNPMGHCTTGLREKQCRSFLYASHYNTESSQANRPLPVTRG